MRFSIIIPARNEELLIGRCLDSIAEAAADLIEDVEVIVVINRCTDGTEAIARERGARIVRNDAKCLAALRNAGAYAAGGEILVTLDADSRMHPGALHAVSAALDSGRFIGGGAHIRPERHSLGIVLTGLLIYAFAVPAGISAGMFWCRREDFAAIGGFNENAFVAEDIDFAKRLRAHGRARGKRFGTLWRTPIITSCRKFDQFGDWFAFRLLLTQPGSVRRALRHGGKELGDRYWYDVER